ncbi:MAG: transcriptional regulator FeaR [Rhodospirillales bacterium]
MRREDARAVRPASEVQRWETARLPTAARWDAWRDALNGTHLPWAIEPRTPPRRFDAELTWRQAADLSLIACRSQPCAGKRDGSEIRATDRPTLGLLLVTEGREAVRQGEVSALLGPGDLFLWDSERPLDFEIRAPLGKVTLLIPKEAAAYLLPRGRRSAPLHLPAERAETTLLAGYLGGLAGLFAVQAEASWQASARSALDLLATAVTAERVLTPESRQEVLRRAVERDIRCFLRDPRLSPAWLAARQGLSTRYIHKLFEGQAQSLAEAIRDRRLEGARRALETADGQGVTQIAYAWGFNSAAHFSRCFKARFGRSPREIRGGPGRQV